MSATKRQPPPSPGGVAIWPLVVAELRGVLGKAPRRFLDFLRADMRARDASGRETYGVPLQAHNGRDALTDAYQEALDLCAYLRQEVEEGTSDGADYTDAVSLCANLKARLLERSQ